MRANNLLSPTESVTGLELFYDLVFVFALTRANFVISAQASDYNFVLALLLFVVLWCVWVSYSWLGSTVRLDSRSATATLMVSMAGLFLMALWLPEWVAGGAAALAFVGAYLLARATHLISLVALCRKTPSVAATIPWVVAGVALSTIALAVGAFVGGSLQVALLACVVILECAPYLLRTRNSWPISIKHFVERYELVIMIAIGEGVVSLGVAASRQSISMAITGYCLFAFAIDCLVWIAYFRILAPRVASAMESSPLLRRPVLARDVYSGLHLLLVLGLVLLAAARTVIIQELQHNNGAAWALSGPAAHYAGLAWIFITVGFVLIRLRANLRVPVAGWIAVLLAATEYVTATRLPILVTVAIALAISLLLIGPTRQKP